MSSTAMMRSSGALVGPSGNVSLLRLGVAGVKAGGLVAMGYLAAEVGSDMLRQGVGQIDAFAKGGAGQSMLVKVVPGLLAAVVIAGFTYRSVSRSSNRMDGARAAAKVAVLMAVGVGASAVKEPLSMAVAGVTARLRGMLTSGTATAARAGADNIDVVDMKDGPDVTWYQREGDPRRAGAAPLPGSSGERVPRAGGDAGMGAPQPVWNPANLARNEHY